MATRLYVGGLGERVTDEDLRKTFSHMGAIESVDMIRSKNRSFAYINFLPSSDNSLLKLFSMYNGCLWKGGKLKLEKAKEHYTDRLKREWAEDAEILNSEDTKHSDVDENMAASLQPKSTLDLENMQLRMFFPKLRKVKSLPFRGTGKHKYSFQRLAAPPHPVHICDCPEHHVDIQNDKVNAKKTNMPNSVINSVRNKGTLLKNRCIQPPRAAKLDDSKIHDDGLNDEEIHVMNSVMKKLLQRESANTEQKDFHDSSQLISESAGAEKKNRHDSPQMIASTFELPEGKDKIEEETDDDDDIKINTGGGQDFESENWEASLVNKMAWPNEQQPSDEPAKSKLGTQKTKLTPSNKKRKSVFNDSSEENPASQIPPKKVHFQIQSKESEEQVELKSVTESVTKKSATSGMWSQKSSWKDLLGDKGTSSFHLSPGGVTNNNEQPISVGETSTDSKKQKVIINDVLEEHKPGNKSLSDEELEKVSNSVAENLDGQTKNREELQAAQLEAGTSAGLDEAPRGSSWLQVSPWTQLVRGGESSSFSLSQILPKDQLEKLKSNKSNNSTTSNTFFGDGVGFGKTRSSRSGLAGEDKKKDARASKGNVNSDSTILKKSDLEEKVSNSTPGVGISETCPFMRSADSLKDWQTAKAALTGALKKRNNNKHGSSS